jgi:hypothetical protein
LQALTDDLRAAAFHYFQDARLGSARQRRDEIRAIYDAAEKRKYELLEPLIKRLSPMNRWQIKQRAHRLAINLPTNEDLQNIDRRDSACAAIATLLRSGGRYEAGRTRSGGKRSRSAYQPVLLAPRSPRNFPKRECERALVERLRLAWRDAAHAEPAATANRDRPGPFVRFVAACLKLVKAPHASAADLINDIAAERKSPWHRSKRNPRPGG